MSYDFATWVFPDSTRLKRKGERSVYEAQGIDKIMEKVFGQRKFGEF